MRSAQTTGPGTIAAAWPGASADECRQLSIAICRVLKHRCGFTLLELLIVCALMATMLSFAIPAYQSYLQRVYRTTALEVLLAAAACEERIHARDFSYDTNRCLPLPAEGDAYAFGFEPGQTASASAYVVIASPMGPAVR